MPRKKYEKPTIIRHQQGLSNKFGRGSGNRSISHIEGVSITELTKEFGSPLFVMSEHKIRRKYREAYRAFSIRYPKVQFAWSYKTNYLDAVCQIFHQEGAWAEVVSEFEYEMARRLGVPADQILFNGPYKPDPFLQQAIEEGAKIHVDHYDELYRIEQIAKKLGRTVPITIRLNMDTGIHPRWDRFGFNLDSGEAFDAVRRIHSGGFLRVEGVHSHIGTFILDPKAYGVQVAKMAALALEIKKLTGNAIEYLDVGGGFASPNTLHDQYGHGADVCPSLDEYANHITSALLNAGFEPDGGRSRIIDYQCGRQQAFGEWRQGLDRRCWRKFDVYGFLVSP